MLKKAFTVASAVVVAAAVLPAADAVLHGDEMFASVADGYFLVFCNGDDQNGPSIDVVDPVLKQRIKSVPVDPGTGWADPVYMETCADEANWVYAADRNLDQIYAFSVQAQDVQGKVAMSDAPVHTYAIPKREEFWAHADGAGVMDVVHLQDPTKLHKEDVKVHVDTPGHGKLLWDEGLWPKAYLSNTREPYVYEIDMTTYSMTRHIQFPNGDNNTDHAHFCPGTHGMAFSSVNGHVYATCSGDVGLAEIDPKTWTIIQKHAGHTGGQVYQDKDEKYIVTIDKSGGKVHFL